MAEAMRVTKTLVIGLGSTGTRILDNVAKRVEWELRDTKRAPWLQFLCVESDISEKSKLQAIDPKDFRDLSISAHDFQHMVNDTGAYDATINLSSWIDPSTIRKLPGQEVTAGVGNIRMLGRLTIFHDANHRKLTNAITERLNYLRTLSEAEATDMRGTLVDGADPPIMFNGGDSIRVIVIGTLCGGTCSGLASDFGYFVRTNLKDTDKLSAIFTLPHPQLTKSHEPRAERFKTNSMHALMELNHYHLSDRQNEPPIRFPDGKEANLKKFPYDLTFLVMPKTVGRTGEEELNHAIADRMFLEVFVPEADSFGDAVNASVFGEGKADRDHRAHVFSTFGLATIEYPAHRIMEACSKRLMVRTLNSWMNQALDEEQADSYVSNDLQVEWGGLKETVLQAAAGGALKATIDQKTTEVIRELLRDPSAAERSLSELRRAFTLQSQSGGNVDPLATGGIPHALKQAKAIAADRVIDKIRALVRRTLTDYDAGPGHISTVLNRIRYHLSDLQNHQPAGFASHQQQVQHSLEKIRVYKRDPLLGLMGLRREAIKNEGNKLRKALDKEIESRLDNAVYAVLQNDPRSKDSGKGLLERVQRQLKPVQKRTETLRNRLTSLSNNLHRRADDLARTEPNINGVTIFEAQSGGRGTVQSAYEQSLSSYVDDSTLEWSEARDHVARDLIQAWDSLADAIVPQDNTNDWLLDPFVPQASQEDMPRDLYHEFEQRALEPFRPLTHVDVLERWYNNPKGAEARTLQAREAVEKASPFLGVNQTLAQQGGRSPVPVRRFLLMPESRHANEFAGAVSGILTNPQRGSSPESFRVVMLEEWYRFPLSATPFILGESNALQNATSSDFPTFWTRKDIGWTGISKHDIQRSREAEEVLAINILLELVDTRQGAILLKLQSGLGEDGSRRLPLSFSRATQMLARGDLDLDGRQMHNAIETLENKIREYLSNLEEDEHDKALTFIKELDRRIKDGIGSVIDDWDKRLIIEYVRRYVARDPNLFAASQQLFAPPRATIAMLKKNVGDPKPRGGTFDEDGLYCPNCGGKIGEDEQDAARNGWRCFVNPNAHHLDNNYGVATTA